MIECDICVVGAGIAGASVAALLAERRRVVVIEQEAHPGYHATGRSVAIFTEAVAGAQVTPLTRASRAFFLSPPEGFSAAPLGRRRGVMTFGPEAARDELRAQFDGLSPECGGRWLEGEAVRAVVPILRAGPAALGVLEPSAFDIDVDALHQGYLRRLRAAGGRLMVGAKLTTADRDGQGWRLTAGGQAIACSVLIDAAGAWADEVARLAGARPIGLEPRRRTVAVADAAGHAVDGWPMCVAAGHDLYFKPDAGRLLVSAMDQSPCAPCDAFADDLDVAVAFDRFSTTVDLPIKKPLHTWAGLRTFAPDAEPVAGYAPDQQGFFWLAGQGGAGVQTGPALAEAAAALVCGGPLGADLTRFGVDAEALAPTRFFA